MNNFFNEKSEYAVFALAPLPKIGKVILVTAVDLDFHEHWITEAYVCLASNPIPISNPLKIGYGSEFESLVPTISRELESLLEIAESMLETHILETNYEFFRDIYPMLHRVKGPLSDSDIIRERMVGGFSNQFKKIREQTRCRSLEGLMDHVKSKPIFYKEELTEDDW